MSADDDTDPGAGITHADAVAHVANRAGARR